MASQKTSFRRKRIRVSFPFLEASIQRKILESDLFPRMFNYGALDQLTPDNMRHMALMPVRGLICLQEQFCIRTSSYYQNVNQCSHKTNNE